MKKAFRNPVTILIALVLAVFLSADVYAAPWTVNPADFRYDMSLYFMPSFTGHDEDISKYEVGAFVGDECRGISESLAGVDNCLYMRIRSNSASGDNITFRLRNTSTGEVTPVEGESIVFESGMALGMPSDPYKLTVRTFYDVSATASEGGSVDFTNGRFPEGTELTITAEPSEGYRFAKWSDGITDATRIITVDRDIELTAFFEKDRFTITYMVDGEVIKSVEMEPGETVIPEEAPVKDGYRFAGWKDLPQTMPAEDLTVEAIYIKVFNVSVNAAEGGSVDFEDGTYDEGAVISVTAVPADGFVFARWSDGLTDARRTMTVDRDIELTAFFERETFTLTYMVDGEVFKSLEMVPGETITPEEAPVKDGRRFVEWKDLPQTMPAEDLTVEAIYIKVFNVSVNAAEGGSVDFEDGIYDEGTVISVTAVPAAGYVFTKWSDGLTDAQRVLTVDRDITLTAFFERETFTLTYMVDGEVFKSLEIEPGNEIVPEEAPVKEGYRFEKWEGLPHTMPAKDIIAEAVYIKIFKVTITASEGGTVDFENGIYDEGTVISVYAKPAKDYRFSRWNDGLTDSIRTMVIERDIELTAFFERNTFTLTYMVDGEVFKSLEMVPGETITPEEAPVKDGSRFVEWKDLPQTMPAEDLSVEAIYIKVFNVSVNATEGGSVDFEDGIYDEGTVISLNAVPAAGYVFSKWSDGLTDAQRTLTVDRDIELTAFFERNTFTLTYMVDGEILKTVEMVPGETITPEEAPVKDGRRFVEWKDLPQTMPAEDLTVEAIYIKVFNVSVNAAEGGSVDFEDGVYDEGAVISLNAVPAAGYVFSKWSDGLTDAQRTLTVDRDIELTAFFERETFTLTYMVDGEILKTVEMVPGETITPEEAPVKDGRRFVEWKDLPQTMPAEDLTVEAIYIKVFNVSVNAAEGGSVDFEDGIYDEGTVISLNAVPAAGYVFSKWSDGLTDAQRTLTVDRDIELTAFFERNTFTLTYMVDGEILKTVEMIPGETITPEEAPEKEGFKFIGWDGLPETMPAEDLTVNAIYEAILYRLTAYINDELYFQTELEMGAPVEIPEPVLPSDWVFKGWDEDIPETMPSHDIEIHGKAEYVSKLETIFSDDDTASFTVYSISGKLLLKDATAREVEDKLPHGIYLVNGKKIVL